MDIRLICMDLDGTTLQNDHKTFSLRLMAALEEAHRRGIAIAPVTGRQYGLLPQCLKEHPVWEDLVAVCNGGQICRLGTGQVLYRLDMAPEPLLQLLALAETLALPIEFSVDSHLYLTPQSLALQQGDPQLTFHREIILPQCGRMVDSLADIAPLGVEKVNLMGITPEKRTAALEGLRTIALSAVWASGTTMEITHRDASKGNALLALCRLLEIPPEKAMALGDSGNDETMLRQAGLGVAMGNAPDFIKAAADAVSETNVNDGAALAIERYALGK